MNDSHFDVLCIFVLAEVGALTCVQQCCRCLWQCRRRSTLQAETGEENYELVVPGRVAGEGTEVARASGQAAYMTWRE